MTTHDPATDHVELELGGMTCAACALHIEKQLNGLDGVSASVNFATERATIDYDAGVVDVVDLIACRVERLHRRRSEHRRTELGDGRASTDILGGSSPA